MSTPCQKVPETETPAPVIERDESLLDNVKDIFDMAGWFINPTNVPLTIERMNEVIAEAGASCR
ncbi:hypothetical protein [Cupriavidus sp. BIS7]|uniref:hypothetical protein n=1 Tax=Cupriavidus sp. BIS7 TaxID=1217718 RepID=UPI0002F2A15C|nr:hypothetical protein [Cupriavidus sp. BIS7]